MHVDYITLKLQNKQWGRYILSGSYMFKIIYRITRTMCEICSKLATERCHWRRFGVIIVNIEHFAPCSSVLIVNFEQVNAGCDIVLVFSASIIISFELAHLTHCWPIFPFYTPWKLKKLVLVLNLFNVLRFVEQVAIFVELGSLIDKRPYYVVLTFRRVKWFDSGRRLYGGSFNPNISLMMSGSKSILTLKISVTRTLINCYLF